MNSSVVLEQLLQPKLRGRHCPPVQTQGLMQLHSHRAPAEIVQEPVVHAHHVLRCEPIFWFLARRHRSGVQLKEIEGVGTEGGGFRVAQSVQGGRRERGADYLKFKKVLSSLELKSFIQLICLVFICDVWFEDVGFVAVGDVSELS